MKKKTPAKRRELARNMMWGGRFSGAPDRLMEEINASIAIDKRLYREDIAGSIAHAHMLADREIISAADARRIIGGLRRIEKEIAAQDFSYSNALEDIHMHIEARLSELIGPAAGRLHTARSRNDQVALDFRLWVKSCCQEIVSAIDHLLKALVIQAEAGAALVMPGFTHLQVAQPITFGHHLLAYAESLQRDRSRFTDALRRMDESPLGAAALAGTSFPIDRKATARALGFRAPMANSIDSVSARDFALEFLSAAAICASNLSRLAEEIVIWSSAQFAFVTLSDSFSTGSSIMPQKRNPDAAELVRAKAGRIIGALNTLLIVMKGLPLAYSKDMQEDKAPVFDAGDTLLLALAAMSGMITDLRPNARAMAAASAVGYSTATDLADWLVRVGGLTFRHAHHVTGRIVALAQHEGVGLAEVPLEQMQKIEECITADIFSVLDVQSSVKSRNSYGGTAPSNVRAQVRRWKRRLGLK